MGTVLIIASEDEAIHANALSRHLSLTLQSSAPTVEKSSSMRPDEDEMDVLQRRVPDICLVVLLVTVDLLANRPWHLLVQAADNSSVPLVPVILKACRWNSTILGTRQVLPRDQKPIAPRKHRDTAWEEVSTGLRDLIDLSTSQVVVFLVRRRKAGRISLRKALRIGGGVLLVILALVTVLPLVSVPPSTPKSDTIVVAGPWLQSSLARGTRQSLCDALREERMEGEGLVCMGLPLFGEDPARVREKAIDAGAALFVSIDVEGSASLFPLGVLADKELPGQGLTIDLSDAGAPKAAARTLRSLAHLAKIGLLSTSRIRCPDFKTSPPTTIALLSAYTSMYRKDCGEDPNVWKVLNDLVKSCREDAIDRKECRLAAYLCADAPDWCDQAARMRERLRDSKDSASRFSANVKAARDACTKGSALEAASAIASLWSSPYSCERLMAAALAPCIVIDGETDGEESRGLAAIEAFADDDDVEPCGTDVVKRAIGERGWWRARAGRWAAAAADYESAWSGLHRPAYLLNLIEVLLRQNNDKDAADRLEELPQNVRLDDVRDEIHRRLLEWIIRRRKGRGSGDMENAANLLVDEYRKHLLDEKQAFENAQDPVLRPLVCPKIGDPCALDILARPKDSGAADRLEAALKETSVP